MSDSGIEGLLEQELSRHPLGHEVMALAAESGTDLGDLGALARIVSGLRDASGSDARVVLLLSAMLDRIATFGTRRDGATEITRGQDSEAER